MIPAVAAAIALAFSAPAFAQGGGVLNPNAGGAGGPGADGPPTSAAPQPALNKDYPVWVGYLVMVLLAAAVMGVSLMPSKRAQQT